MLKRILFLSLALLVASSMASAETVSHYFSVVRDATGAAVPSSQVTVYAAGTTDLVVIYSDPAGLVLKGNPFLSDSVGNYDFYIAPGLYKVVVTKPLVGTFTTDNIAIGTQLHEDTHKSGGTDELSLDDFAGTISSARITNATILNEDVAANAAIAESKLALSFPTHSNATDPSADQKSALGGTAGLPSNANRYVTNADSRMTNNRFPTVHAFDHEAGGNDPVAITQAQITGKSAGTDLTADLEEEQHASEHQNNGADEISVAGLSGTLVDAQPVAVSKGGVAVGTQTTINLIEGSNVTITATENGGAVDVTLAANVTAGSLNAYEGVTVVQTGITKASFGNGFDLTAPGTAEVQVDLDLTELTVNADEIDGEPVDMTGVEDGNILVYITDTWVPTVMDPAGVAAYEEMVQAATTVTNFNFGAGFDLEGTEGDGLNVTLDLSEITVDADQLQGSDIDTTPPSDGYVLKWDAANSYWEPAVDLSAGSVVVEEKDVSKVATLGTLDFGDGFDVTEDPSTEANVVLDLTEISVNANTVSGLPYGVPAGPLAPGMVPVWSGGDDAFDYMFPTTIVSDTGGSHVELSIEALVFETEDFYLSTATENIFGLGFPQKYSLIQLREDGIKDVHVDWGSAAGQVDLDDVPNGVSKKLSNNEYLSLTQMTDSTIHYHGSDRALANATGTLDATKVGTGLTDAQVSDTLTVAGTGAVDATAIKSGTIGMGRVGNLPVETKSLIVPYPTAGTQYGYIYFPTTVTITRVSARSKGATCNVNFRDDGVGVLAADLAATTSGATTTAITNTAIAAGSWAEFAVGATCPSTVTEVTINVTYTIN